MAVFFSLLFSFSFTLPLRLFAHWDWHSKLSICRIVFALFCVFSTWTCRQIDRSYRLGSSLESVFVLHFISLLCSPAGTRSQWAPALCHMHCVTIQHTDHWLPMGKGTVINTVQSWPGLRVRVTDDQCCKDCTAVCPNEQFVHFIRGTLTYSGCNLFLHSRLTSFLPSARGPFRSKDYGVRTVHLNTWVFSTCQLIYCPLGVCASWRHSREHTSTHTQTHTWRTIAAIIASTGQSCCENKWLIKHFHAQATLSS